MWVENGYVEINDKKNLDTIVMNDDFFYDKFKDPSKSWIAMQEVRDAVDKINKTINANYNAPDDIWWFWKQLKNEQAENKLFSEIEKSLESKINDYIAAVNANKIDAMRSIEKSWFISVDNIKALWEWLTNNFWEWLVQSGKNAIDRVANYGTQTWNTNIIPTWRDVREWQKEIKYKAAKWSLWDYLNFSPDDVAKDVDKMANN